MGKIVGIDLGNTSSVVAVMVGDQPQVIPDRDGSRTTPSVVAFTKSGAILVGQRAKNQAIMNPANTIYSIKRLMGRRYDAVVQEVRSLPYKVIAVDAGEAGIKANGRDFRPPLIAAMILRSLKEAAEAQLGEAVTKAVIAAPAYFDDVQRQATKDAGQIAGLEVIRIVNEPAAAALAYGAGQKKNGIIAVYDLGGSTFDISILDVNDGVFEVLSTNGDTHLGGDTIDECVVEWLTQQCNRDLGVRLKDLDKTAFLAALSRLKIEAENAKKALSTASEYEVNLPYLAMNQGVPVNLMTVLTRAKLEELVRSIVERSMEPCKRALADAGVKPPDIGDVLLVGGATRMPMVQQVVAGLFGKKPNSSVNPDEAVALGAAVQAGILAG